MIGDGLYRMRECISRFSAGGVSRSTVAFEELAILARFRDLSATLLPTIRGKTSALRSPVIHPNPSDQGLEDHLLSAKSLPLIGYKLERNIEDPPKSVILGTCD